MVERLRQANDTNLTVQCALPLDRRSAGRARRRARAILLEWGLNDIVDVVVLLTSELVANAVVHARTPVELTVCREIDRVRVAVADRSPDPPARRHAADDDEHGRGLALVDSLSLRWGTEPTSSGKRVWFEVAA